MLCSVLLFNSFFILFCIQISLLTYMFMLVVIWMFLCGKFCVLKVGDQGFVWDSCSSSESIVAVIV